MDGFLVQVFATQVWFHAKVMLIENKRIRAILDDSPKPGPDFDVMTDPWVLGQSGYGLSTELWASVESLLNAAASIARVCWGQRGDLAEAREAVRAYIGIDDLSPLKSVDMRNHFQHFDERIDRWWAESESRSFIDKVSGHDIEVITGDPLNAFRILDFRTMEVVFWGERFSLQALVDEAERLCRSKSPARSPRASGGGQ
jgi:hypothetical protein